jgi:hypothetical protein
MSINRRQVLAQVSLVSGAAMSGCATGAPAGGAPQRQTSIRPGEVWLDTSGKPIQAHAGALIAVGDSVFYWYGENKEFTDGK